MRHLVAILDPRTGTHRGLSEIFHVEGDEPHPKSVHANVVPAIVQHLAPQPHEAAVILNIPETTDNPAPPPRPTLKAV